MLYCPKIAGVAPNWVYALCAFCVFMFQTLDAVDGKQARYVSVPRRQCGEST